MILRAQVIRFVVVVFILTSLCFAQTGNNAPASQAPTGIGAETAATRILFIGNSYTYFNNLPQILAQLAASAAPPKQLSTERITVGGATLKRHWEDGKAVEAIKKKKWDYVVLQEQSTLGISPMVNGVPQINDPKIFHEYARLFDAEIRKTGAKTVFFMTWARQNAPDTQLMLTSAYQKIAWELNAILIPAGIAWENARHANPRLPLHAADKSHPSPHGSYLAACLFYTTMFEKSPEGLPARISGPGVDGSGKSSGETETELVNLTAEAAGLLQRIAWETHLDGKKQAVQNPPH